jgi:hypothetical protein
MRISVPLVPTLLALFIVSIMPPCKPGCGRDIASRGVGNHRSKCTPYQDALEEVSRKARQTKRPRIDEEHGGPGPIDVDAVCPHAISCAHGSER